MEFFIAGAPEDHPVIPGSGGFRKARWARRGKGKSGGFRLYIFPAETGSYLHDGDLRQVTPGDAIGCRSECSRKTCGTNQKGSEGERMSMSVRNSKVQSKRTKLGLALEKSAREILDHVKGNSDLPTRQIVLPAEVDVKRIRSMAGMSQSEFARAFCINPRTLQEWEQGRRKPDATSRAYLAVIAKNRQAVLDALAS